MNGLFFYLALGLMLGGGLFLLSAGKRGVRSMACITILAGLGVLAAGVKVWLVLGFDLFAVSFLLFTFARRRRSDVTAIMEVEWGDDFVPAAPVKEIEDKEVHSGSALRKGVAALLSAGVAGILLSVIWNNSLWKIKTPAERPAVAPGLGIILLLVLLLLLFFFSFQSGRPVRQGGEGSDSEE